MLQQRGGAAKNWEGKCHHHTRQYLRAFEDGDGGDAAQLPPAFYEKLRLKGQSEVLRPVDVEEAVKRLREKSGGLDRHCAHVDC
eukprot:SAG11_NODE_1676_length_4475_cov_6.069698_6_plen_84_part_00